jgi:hypothetical protein
LTFFHHCIHHRLQKRAWQRRYGRQGLRLFLPIINTFFSPFTFVLLITIIITITTTTNRLRQLYLPLTAA